jgi:hypothetical protein
LSAISLAVFDGDRTSTMMEAWRVPFSPRQRTRSGIVVVRQVVIQAPDAERAGRYRTAVPVARCIQGKSEMVSQVLDDDAVLVRGEGVGDSYLPADQLGGQAAEVHRLELLDRVAALVRPG